MTDKYLFYKIPLYIVTILGYVFIDLLLNIPSVQAQSAENKLKYENIFVETKIHYGFIMKHHDKMAHLQSSHFSAFEINAGFQTYGKNPWDKLYKYPKIGCAFWYSDLGRSPYLGSAYAIYPYMNFPIIDKRKLFLNFRFGLGIGYLSKKFDRFENYKGIAIGSHINAAISLLFETRFKINNRLFINSGVGLTHFSNAAFKTPNLGINIPTFNLGLLGYISKNRSERIENHPPVQNKKYEFNTFIAFGLKEMYPPMHKKYFTCSYSGIFYKLNKQKNKYGLGVDLFYNTGNLTVLNLPTDDFYSNISIIRIGVSLAYELRYNHISFLIQTGPYIHSRDKTDGNIYTRIGLRYLLSDHWFANLTLKAHFGKADHIECGLGYRF